jgi:hypothetical protein
MIETKKMPAVGDKVRVIAPDSYLQRIRKNIRGRVGVVIHAFKTPTGRGYARVEFSPCEGFAHRFVNDFPSAAVEVVKDAPEQIPG